MLYTNPFPATYQPQFSQYQNQYQPPQQQQYQAFPQAQPSPPQQNVNAGSGIVWVQGEAGAKSYLVAAGTSVLLMDSETNVFYIKTTDQSGVPLPLETYEYHKRESASPRPFPAQDASQYVTREELDRRLSEIFPQQKKQQNNPQGNQRKEAQNG